MCQRNKSTTLIMMTLSWFSLSPGSIDWDSLGRENSMCRVTRTRGPVGVLAANDSMNGPLVLDAKARREFNDARTELVYS